MDVGRPREAAAGLCRWGRYVEEGRKEKRRGWWLNLTWATRKLWRQSSEVGVSGRSKG